jgi:glucan biosynthesis protein
LTIYALLDSPRATGAYQFDIHPGGETVMDVRGRIFLRSSVATLGIAPLTSMFFFGENQPHRTDFRPEVHDSDGLMVATGDGEWIWRPLINPRQTLTTSFSMQTVRGFGLMQRDRDFRNYEDSEARYELRPSAWVEPTGTWAPGRSSSCNSTRPTRPTTTSSRTGCRATRPRRASRSTSRIDCTGKASSKSNTRRAPGFCRRGLAAATQS